MNIELIIYIFLTVLFCYYTVRQLFQKLSEKLSEKLREFYNMRIFILIYGIFCLFIQIIKNK